MFGEISEYDGEGQLLSCSFMDCPMPGADLLRRIDIELRGVPFPGDQISAKSVGEAGTVGALPPVMDALASEGIWQALQTATVCGRLRRDPWPLRQRPRHGRS